MEQFEQFDVVLVSVSFAEDRTQTKTRRCIVLQQDGELVQLIWASSREVDASSPRAWEFCVADRHELAAMGHTKPARYSFRRGGVIVTRREEIIKKVGHAPKSVISRLVAAARNS
jgi:hypothetical protein